MGLGYLDPTDQGIYRVARGKMGASDVMSQDVGYGGRYVITTGEAADVNGGTAALPNTWRRAFDVHSPGFALIVLGFVLLLIHARAGVGGSVSGSVRASAGR